MEFNLSKLLRTNARKSGDKPADAVASFIGHKLRPRAMHTF